MILTTIPTCLGDAYRLMADDRAFVVIVPIEGGVRVSCSTGRVREMPRKAWPYLDLAAPWKARMSFLLGGVCTVVEEVTA